MPMGTEAQRAGIWLKAPQRVRDPAAGCAPSSTSTQCHGRPALTGDSAPPSSQVHTHTRVLTCTRAHTCLCLCSSWHMACPLPAPACKALALIKQAEHTPPRGPEAARAACLLLTSFLPQTGLEIGAPGHGSEFGASVPRPHHHEGSKDSRPFLRLLGVGKAVCSHVG